MQFDNRIIAAAMALAFLVGAFSFIGSDVDADPEITRDYGQFYSYTLQFVFDGAEALRQCDLHVKRLEHLRSRHSV